MKRTIGNYINKTWGNFPCDCELFDYISENNALLTTLGNIGGDKIILKGCELVNNGSRREPGYVFLQTKDYPEGEVIYWEGGPVSSGMYLQKEAIQVETLGNEYPEAYTMRYLSAGVGVENYSWNDFVNVPSQNQLEAMLENQTGLIAQQLKTAIGSIEIWAGSVNDIPPKYKLCDGTTLLIADYGALYGVIGTTYGSATNGFKVPDLRSQFLVGYSSSDSVFSTLGKKGGKKTVSLTSAEMPSHYHQFEDYYMIESGPNPDANKTNFGSSSSLGKNYQGMGSSDSDNRYLWYYRHNSASTGSGSAHENRPPYFTLSYIIKANI